RTCGCRFQPHPADQHRGGEPAQAEHQGGQHGQERGPLITHAHLSTDLREERSHAGDRMPQRDTEQHDPGDQQQPPPPERPRRVSGGRRRTHWAAFESPSMLNCCPEMVRACGPARNTASCPISAGSVNFLTAWFSRAACCSCSGVRPETSARPLNTASRRGPCTAPGCREFTVIRCGPSSRDSVLANPTSPHFVV